MKYPFAETTLVRSVRLGQQMLPHLKYLCRCVLVTFINRGNERSILNTGVPVRVSSPFWYSVAQVGFSLIWIRTDWLDFPLSAGREWAADIFFTAFQLYVGISGSHSTTQLKRSGETFMSPEKRGRPLCAIDLRDQDASHRNTCSKVIRRGRTGRTGSKQSRRATLLPFHDVCE